MKLIDNFEVVLMTLALVCFIALLGDYLKGLL